MICDNFKYPDVDTARLAWSEAAARNQPLPTIHMVIGHVYYCEECRAYHVRQVRR